METNRLSESQEESIARFIQYSRGTREQAIQWLELSDWNVDNAMECFWRHVVMMSDYA